MTLVRKSETHRRVGCFIVWAAKTRFELVAFPWPAAGRESLARVAKS